MTGPAQRPTDSSGQAGPRREREPESASFEPARITRRGRQPVIVFAFIAILGSVVAIGVAGRTAPPPTGALPATVSSATATPSQGGSAPSTPAAVSPTRAPLAVIKVGLDGPIELRIRRPTASIFVHGDVYATKVTWIFISLQDASGDVKGFASVSVPGSAVANDVDGPSLRFDLDVAVSPDLAGHPVWVQAIAYDATGKVVGTVRVGVGADGNQLDAPTTLAPAR